MPDDVLGYSFPAALGSRYGFAEPAMFALEYAPKVEMEIKHGPSGGGCG